MRRRLATAALAAAAAGAVLRARRSAEPREVSLPVLATALTVASVPALARQAARERDPLLFWTLVSAQLLRFAVALAHVRVIEREYAGITDIDEYDPAGRAIAAHLHAHGIAGLGEVMRTVPWETPLRGRPLGTNLMRALSGGAYAAVGPSRRAGFVLFSWLGFWGLFAFYRAFALAVPRGRNRSYLRLLFFLPSLSFHTSSMGKEAWMVMSLGTGALGTARTLTGSPGRGIAQAALGGALAAAMRVQVGGRHGLTIGAELRDAGARSSFGGSAFAPPELRSARDAPAVAGTVLFRPHLLEASNLQARAAALEGSFLALLTIARLRWLLAAAGGVRREPYVGFAGGCSAVLIWYLSRVSNFGMLVRQRVSLLPFYLVWLSVPPRR